MHCTNCGNKVPNNARVCGNCGHQLMPAEAAVQPPTQPAGLIGTSKRTTGWVWAVLTGVVAFVFIYLLFLSRAPTEIAVLPNATTPSTSPQMASTSTIEGISQLENEPQIDMPASVGLFFEGARVLFQDDFDSLSSEDFYTEKARTSDGKLVMTAQDWDSHLYLDKFYDTPIAALVLFQYDTGSDFVISLIRGDWMQPAYREITLLGNCKCIAQGEDDQFSKISGAFPLNANTWYYALFSIGEDGVFQFYIWEPDRPFTLLASFSYTLASDWEFSDWQFHSALGNNLMSIDSLDVFTFP